MQHPTSERRSTLLKRRYDIPKYRSIELVTTVTGKQMRTPGHSQHSTKASTLVVVFDLH